jgi:hypothetical protein
MECAPYPDDLLPRIQATLAALADIELRFDLAREEVERLPMPDGVRRDLVAELERRRASAVAAYECSLDDLRRRANAAFSCDLATPEDQPAKRGSAARWTVPAL